MVKVDDIYYRWQYPIGVVEYKVTDVDGDNITLRASLSSIRFRYGDLYAVVQAGGALRFSCFEPRVEYYNALDEEMYLYKDKDSATAEFCAYDLKRIEGTIKSRVERVQTLAQKLRDANARIKATPPAHVPRTLELGTTVYGSDGHSYTVFKEYRTLDDGGPFYEAVRQDDCDYYTEGFSTEDLEEAAMGSSRGVAVYRYDGWEGDYCVKEHMAIALSPEILARALDLREVESLSRDFAGYELNAERTITDIDKVLDRLSQLNLAVVTAPGGFGRIRMKCTKSTALILKEMAEENLQQIKEMRSSLERN